MNEELRKEFETRVVESAGEAVKFAVQRNILGMMKEIEQRTNMGPDENSSDKENIMLIKLSVVHDKFLKASIRVKECSWNRKIKFVDDDFPKDDIDVLQPDMFDEYRKKTAVPEPRHEADDKRRRNLLKAAAEMKADYFEPCGDETEPNYISKIDRISPDGTLTRKMTPANMMWKVLEAAADQGGIVIDLDGTIKKQSVEKLLRNGYEVVTRQDGGLWLMELGNDGEIDIMAIKVISSEDKCLEEGMIIVDYDSDETELDDTDERE